MNCPIVILTPGFLSPSRPVSCVVRVYMMLQRRCTMPCHAMLFCTPTPSPCPSTHLPLAIRISYITFLPLSYFHPCPVRRDPLLRKRAEQPIRPISISRQSPFPPHSNLNPGLDRLTYRIKLGRGLLCVYPKYIIKGKYPLQHTVQLELNFKVICEVVGEVRETY